MEIRVLMNRAAEVAVDVVDGIRGDQLRNPTPCEEYDVRALLNHMFLWTGERAQRAAGKQEVTEWTDTPDEVGTLGWAERYGEEARITAAAWSKPDAWTGETGLSGKGKMPAPFIGGLIFGELLLHSWDMAVATDQELEIDPELVQALWTRISETAERARQWKVFGPEVAVPETAPLLDRTLGLAGRDPNWVA